jgi:hypothetical protein
MTFISKQRERGVVLPVSLSLLLRACLAAAAVLSHNQREKFAAGEDSSPWVNNCMCPVGPVLVIIKCPTTEEAWDWPKSI